jgi:glucose/arabinose dehydrogenase
MTRAIVALGSLIAISLGSDPSHAASITAEPVLTGLAFPAAFTFVTDGKIFYGERFTGEIRIFDPATATDSLFFTVPDLATAGEQGLLGLALHPNFPLTPYVYAYATRNTGAGVVNQVLRITNSGGVGTNRKVLLSEPAGTHHNGGRIVFGPDQKLYVVIGDRGTPSNSQNFANHSGKVLRMTAGGGIPSSNPFPGSLIYAYGLRNSFGLAFDPLTDWLWETDNGPECNDELNLIRRGWNLGWGPNKTCSSPPDPPANTNQDGPNPRLPRRWYTPPIAPTGLAFCLGCGLGSASTERLFFGTWNTGEIRRVTLHANRRRVISEDVAYDHGAGVLSIEVAPDGTLYFSDSSAIYKLVLTP